MSALRSALLAVLVALLAVFEGQAAAQTVHTLVAEADSKLRLNKPTTNYGGSNTLVVVTDSKERRGLVAFDLSDISGGEVISDARLKLYVRNAYSQSVDVHRVTAPWTEGGVTWSNIAASHDAVAETSFIPATEDAYTDVDVTSLAQDWHDGTHDEDGVMLIMRGNFDNLHFETIDDGGGNPPYLHVVTNLGTYDITADRDAFIEESSPGGNFGSDDRIKVNIADLDTYRSVVRFDVASLPAGKVVTDATLRLYVTDGSSDTMSVHRMTSAWTEGGVTWNTHASSYDPAAIVGFVPSVEEAFADIDLTATVDDWYRGITVNDGLMILTTGDDGFDFKARETGDPASRPRLLVTFADPVLALGRTATVLNDPIDGASNPHAVPGAVVRHEITVTNAGLGSPDDDTVVVLDDLSSHAALFAGDLGGGGSGPVSFTDGIPSSALTYTFTSLGSGTDDLDFSNDGGSSWTYVPTPDGDGYDTAVTHIRIRPQGTFAPESGGQSASFRIGYRVRVR